MNKHPMLFENNQYPDNIKREIVNLLNNYLKTTHHFVLIPTILSDNKIHQIINNLGQFTNIETIRKINLHMQQLNGNITRLNDLLKEYEESINKYYNN